MPLNYIKNSYNNLKRDWWDNGFANRNFYSALGEGNTWFHKNTAANLGNATLNAAISIPVNTVAGIANLPSNAINLAMSPFTDKRIATVPYWTGHDFFDGDEGVSENAATLGSLYGGIRGTTGVMDAGLKMADKGARIISKVPVATTTAAKNATVVANTANTAKGVKGAQTGQTASKASTVGNAAKQAAKTLAAAEAQGNTIFGPMEQRAAQRQQQGSYTNKLTNMRQAFFKDPRTIKALGIGGIGGLALGTALGIGSKHRLLYALLGGLGGTAAGAYIANRKLGYK